MTFKELEDKGVVLERALRGEAGEDKGVGPGLEVFTIFK